jgi:general stress protein 26
MPAISIVFASLVIVAAVTVAAHALPADAQAALQTQKEIYIATRRANGSRSAAVPVWFWWDAANQVLYTSTSPDAHKAKRIRKGSPVYVSVQGKDGPFFEGTAELVTDLQLVEHLGTEYANKYWIAWLGFFRPRPERVSAGKTVVVKVILKSSR